MADRVFVPGGNAISGVVGNTSKGGYDRGKLLVSTNSGGKLDTSFLPDGLSYLVDNYHGIVSRLDSCITGVGDMRRELSNFMADVDTRLETLELAVSAVSEGSEGRISSLENRADEHDAAVSRIDDTLSSLSSRMSDMSNDIVPGVDVAIQGIRDDVDAAVGGVRTLTASVEGALADVAEARIFAESLQTDLNAKYAAIQNIVQAVGVMLDGVDSLDLYTEGLSSLRDDLIDVRDGLNETVNGFIDRVWSVESSLLDLSNDVRSSMNAISELSDIVSGIKSDYVVSSQLSEAVSASAGDIDGRLLDLSNDVSFQLTGIGSRLSGIESSVSSLADLPGAVEQARLETLAVVLDLSNDMWYFANDIGPTVDSIHEALYDESNGITGRIMDLTGRVDNVYSRVDGMSSRLDSVLFDCEDFRRMFNDLSNDVADVRLEMSDMSNDLSSVSGSLHDLSNDVSSMLSTVSDLSNDVHSVAGAFVDLSNDVRGISDHVEDLSNDVSGLRLWLDDVSNDMSSVSSRLDGIDSRVDDLSNDVSDLQSDGGATSKGGVTLVPAGESVHYVYTWVLSPQIENLSVVWLDDSDHPDGGPSGSGWFLWDTQGDTYASYSAIGDLTSTNLSWTAGYDGSNYTVSAVLTPIRLEGYRIGPDSNDNPNWDKVLVAYSDEE